MCVCVRLCVCVCVCVCLCVEAQWPDGLVARICNRKVPSSSPGQEKKVACVVSLDKALYSHCLSPPSCKNGTWLRLGRQRTVGLHKYHPLVAVVQVGLRVPTPSVTMQFSASWCTLAQSQEDLSARAQRSCVARRKPGSCSQTAWPRKRQLLTLLLFALCVCVCVYATVCPCVGVCVWRGVCTYVCSWVLNKGRIVQLSQCLCCDCWVTVFTCRSACMVVGNYPGSCLGMPVSACACVLCVCVFVCVSVEHWWRGVNIAVRWLQLSTVDWG